MNKALRIMAFLAMNKRNVSCSPTLEAGFFALAHGYAVRL
jgi:hypothetical protein